MILVLVSSFGLGFETMKRRAVKYQSQARSHAASELYCRNAAATLEREILNANMYYKSYLKAIRRNRSPDEALTSEEAERDRLANEEVKKLVSEFTEEAAGWRKKAADHAALRLRYERAVWRPWLIAP